MTAQKKQKPERAIIDGKIATFINGRRIVMRYISGQAPDERLPHGRENMF